MYGPYPIYPYNGGMAAQRPFLPPVNQIPYRNVSFFTRVTANGVKASYTKEEAAAIALLLGIDFNQSKFNLDEFWMGVNTELEHGRKYYQTNVTADDPITTGKIALAHLNEFPDYYKRLKVLEEEAKAYWNKQ